MYIPPLCGNHDTLAMPPREAGAVTQGVCVCVGGGGGFGGGWRGAGGEEKHFCRPEAQSLHRVRESKSEK